MYQVKTSIEMGRGVYADRVINQNETVMLCELLILDELDTKAVNKTSLKYYTFKFTDKTDCLVLGLGEIFNHDDQANVKYELIQVDGRYMMQFTALTQIDAGSQLFIDYAADALVNVNAYLKANSLVG